VKYYTPAEFMSLRRIGTEMGFKHVQSGPLVRSSYHAAEQVPGQTAAAAV
jgi:lipoic acid synthetase